MIVSVIVPVSDDEILAKNLLLSPDLACEDHEIIIQKGFQSASLAYNDGIERARNEVIILIHQDMYLPHGWFDRLDELLNTLNGVAWGVLGAYGVDQNGVGQGLVYCNGERRILGEGHSIANVETLDEILLVINKKTSLRFDSDFPGFHLYASDICKISQESGFKNYAIGNLCIHNTLKIKNLPNDFWVCVRYFFSKWKHLLPIETSCMTVRRRMVENHLYRLKRKISYSRLGAIRESTRIKDIQKFCENLNISEGK